MSGISSGSDICIDKGESCCAVGCMNRFAKGTPIHLYRFPDDPARKARWISAVNRKEWTPNEHSWICSDHFVSGNKSNDPASDMVRHERLSWPKRERTLRLINRLLQQHF